MRDTIVLRFNPPVEPGFEKRDSENEIRNSLCVRDTTVLHFNAPAESGFEKRDLEKRDSKKRDSVKHDSKAAKTRFGKQDSENGIRKTRSKNGIRKTRFGKTGFRTGKNEIQKSGFGKTGFESSKNGIRKTGFEKQDSENSRSPSSISKRSAFKPIGPSPAKTGSSLSVLCNCSSRPSSPSTGSIAIYVVSIFTCTT